jgi:hypothetical protein
MYVCFMYVCMFYVYVPMSKSKTSNGEIQIVDVKMHLSLIALTFISYPDLTGLA